MQSSLITRSRQSKLNAMAGGMAITIARANKDPLYLKYKFMRKKYKKLQQVIERRYGRQAMNQARGAANRTARTKSGVYAL